MILLEIFYFFKRNLWEVILHLPNKLLNSTAFTKCMQNFPLRILRGPGVPALQKLGRWTEWLQGDFHRIPSDSVLTCIYEYIHTHWTRHILFWSLTAHTEKKEKQPRYPKSCCSPGKLWKKTSQTLQEAQTEAVFVTGFLLPLNPPWLSLCARCRCLRNSTRTGAPCRPRKDPRYTKWGFMAGGRGASISLCCS